MRDAIAVVIRRVVKRLLVIVRVSRVLAGSIIDIIQYLPSQLNVIISELSDLSIVDAEDLGFLRGAQGEAGDQVHDEEDDAGAEEGVGCARDGIGDLVAELNPVLVEPAAVDLGEAIEVRYVVGGEEGCEDVADESTDGVLSEDIEGIVDAEDKLELGGILMKGVNCDSEDRGDFGFEGEYLR